MIDINGIVKMFERYAKQLGSASSNGGSPSSQVQGQGFGTNVGNVQSQGAVNVVPTGGARVKKVIFTGPGLCIVSPSGQMACVRIDGRLGIHELAELLRRHVPEGTLYCLYSPGSSIPFRCAPSIEQLLSQY